MRDVVALSLLIEQIVDEQGVGFATGPSAAAWTEFVLGVENPHEWSAMC